MGLSRHTANVQVKKGLGCKGLPFREALTKHCPWYVAMTPTQYKAAIKALGLSQERAGDWLGIGRRTSQGYALGEYPVPEPVAKLLRLMIRLKLKPEDVG